MAMFHLACKGGCQRLWSFARACRFSFISVGAFKKDAIQPRVSGHKNKGYRYKKKGKRERERTGERRKDWLTLVLHLPLLMHRVHDAPRSHHIVLNEATMSALENNTYARRPQTTFSCLTKKKAPVTCLSCSRCDSRD